MGPFLHEFSWLHTALLGEEVGGTNTFKAQSHTQRLHLLFLMEISLIH